MTNHMHLLVQISVQPLGKLMQRVGTRFARRIQKELSTTGHLFENRYHALLVDVDSYFLELLRYIHLNPVRARIVEAPHLYRWSSHRVYLGKTVQPWVHTDFALRLFSEDESRARSLYRAFIEERISIDDQTFPEAHPRERRVIGDDRFVEKLAVPILRRPAATSLDAIITEVCNATGVTVEAVRSNSRSRHLNKVRAKITVRAMDEHVATLSQLARYFNRSASALSRAIERYRP